MSFVKEQACNLYDEKDFFDAYAQMPRSRGGLTQAGEWHQLQPMFPDVTGMRVLDLGCGYGWHCKYAAEQGADSVLGIDASQRMLEEAKRRNQDNKITYQVCGIESYQYPVEQFDFVISNLALHYVEDLEKVYKNVKKTLKSGGIFLFNIEHPTFTAGVGQDWIYDEEGRPAYWPVDRYYEPGMQDEMRRPMMLIVRARKQ